MARNEEKHYGKLNRMLLQQEKEEFLKKNPLRPKLAVLNSVNDIKQWLPSITKDLDFYLAQSQVTCYPERKIKEFQDEISRLQRQHRAFVLKLRSLDPQCKVTPWTSRAYQQSNKRRKSVPDGDGREVAARKVPLPAAKFQRLALPILSSDLEHTYSTEKEENTPVVQWNCNQTTADQPLCFVQKSVEIKSDTQTLKAVSANEKEGQNYKNVARSLLESSFSPRKSSLNSERSDALHRNQAACAPTDKAALTQLVEGYVSSEESDS